MIETGEQKLFRVIDEQEKRIAVLERIVVGDSVRMDLIELELAMHRSQQVRVKSALDYVEESVASEFNLCVRDFWRKPAKAGRPAGNVLAEYRQAQHVLFSFLVHVVGYTVEDLKNRYGRSVVTYSREWVELYNLIHRSRESLLANKEPRLREKDLRRWDTYAPRYKGAYQKWKQSMVSDGVWPELYDDQVLTEKITLN